MLSRQHTLRPEAKATSKGSTGFRKGQEREWGRRGRGRKGRRGTEEEILASSSLESLYPQKAEQVLATRRCAYKTKSKTLTKLQLYV